MTQILQFHFVILAFVCATVPPCIRAQESDSLKDKCSSIILSSIDADGEGIITSSVNRLRLIPLKDAKAILLKGLDSEEISVRLFSSEILLELAPNEIEDRIRQSLSELRTADPIDFVWRASLLMKMGDETAKSEVEHWALHEFARFDMNEWICPMMCIESSNEAGKCPVCAMELQKRSRSPTSTEWQAKVLAIQALHENETEIREVARAVVASDAPASVRLQAAGLWAREDLDAALPHIQIHLHSVHQFPALSLMVDLAPKRFVKEFTAIVNDESKVDTFNRLEAIRGLLRAGDHSHLVQIRQWVDQPAETDQRRVNRIAGISLLSEVAMPEDMARLEKLLDTEFGVFAAEAILGALADKDR